MKNSFLKSIKQISWIAFVVLFALSCEKENMSPQTAEQKQALAEASGKDNSQIVAAEQDVMNVTAGALAGRSVTNGRYSSYGKMPGPDLDCSPAITGSFTIDKSADSVVYKGSLTIDYGNGSSCKDSTEIRKGKIIDSFLFIERFKDSIAFSLSETIMLQGFQKDSIKLDGEFISNSSSRAIAT